MGVGMSKKKQPNFTQALIEAYGTEPTSVVGIWNARSDYYWGQLQKILFATCKVEYNEEDNRWDKDYIKEGLLLKGLFNVCEDDNGVLLPLKCGATGVNVFNRATTTVIANPVVGSFERTIGVDTEIVYLQQKQGSRFKNFRCVLDVFSQRLANADAAIDINLINSRVPYIFQAKDNKVADSFKAMYDEITSGKPAVFVDESMGNLLPNTEGSAITVIKAKENFIADVVQNEKRQIMDEFLITIGVNTANTTKRERQVVDEVNANNLEVECNIDLYANNVKECCDRVNKMFPSAGLKITFPYYEKLKESANRPIEPEQKGGAVNESD